MIFHRHSCNQPAFYCRRAGGKQQVYIKISEAEIADDYTEPSQYDKVQACQIYVQPEDILCILVAHVQMKLCAAVFSSLPSFNRLPPRALGHSKKAPTVEA